MIHHALNEYLIYGTSHVTIKIRLIKKTKSYHLNVIFFPTKKKINLNIKGLNFILWKYQPFCR